MITTFHPEMHFSFAVKLLTSLYWCPSPRHMKNLYVRACQSQLESLQRGTSNPCFKEEGIPEYHEQIAPKIYS